MPRDALRGFALGKILNAPSSVVTSYHHVVWSETRGVVSMGSKAILLLTVSAILTGCALPPGVHLVAGFEREYEGNTPVSPILANARLEVDDEICPDSAYLSLESDISTIDELNYQKDTRIRTRTKCVWMSK